MGHQMHFKTSFFGCHKMHLVTHTLYLKQDCFLKKEAEGTLAALEFLIAWGERQAFALVKFSHIIMKEIC